MQYPPPAADSHRRKTFPGPLETAQPSALQGMGLNSGKEMVLSPKASMEGTLTFTGELPQAALMAGRGPGGCSGGDVGSEGMGMREVGGRRVGAKQWGVGMQRSPRRA